MQIIKSIVKIFIILIVIAGLFSLYNWGNNVIVGSSSYGYVTKETYSHYGSPKIKIAVVTGMHPREDVSKSIVPNVIKFYALTHNVEIVNYAVTVTKNPDDFNEGRNNGENIVAQYAIPDISKSNYDLVIICHDHQKGYGDGYYIATPTMDYKSVGIGDAVHDLLPSFNYYKRNAQQKSQSSSINKVDAPITKSGTPVFVYEIPEWNGNIDAFLNSYKLIDSSIKVLT